MRGIRSVPLLLIVGASVLWAQDAIVLRRELKTDAKDVYKVESTADSVMDIPQMGEQQMKVKSSMTYTLQTGEVTDGVAAMSSIMSDIKYEMSGPMADLMQNAPPPPKEIKFKGKIDGRNRITDFKVDGTPDMMTAMMAGSSSFTSFFIEFPDKPVKVGDTWPVVIPKNPMVGNKESTLTATLVGEKDGKWHLKMVGDIILDGDLSEMMKGQDPTGTGIEMKLLVTGKIKMASESLVDKRSGKTLEMTTTMDSDSTTEIENLGMKTTQKSKGTVKLTLQG